MSEFKVGDRVVVTSLASPCDAQYFAVGDYGTVVDKCEWGVRVNFFHQKNAINKIWWVDPSSLKLYDQPQYKVGDVVRARRQTDLYNYGDIGLVVRIHENGDIIVDWDRWPTNAQCGMLNIDHAPRNHIMPVPEEEIPPWSLLLARDRVVATSDGAHYKAGDEGVILEACTHFLVYFTRIDRNVGCSKHKFRYRTCRSGAGE